MKHNFDIGDNKYFTKIVTKDDLARFETGEVHPFYGTFAVARDAEWCSRLFVLEMKEEHEEGIGTFVNIVHVSPALEGQEVDFCATITRFEGNDLHCSITASVGDRIVAKGSTGQKILSKTKIDEIKNSV